MLLMILGIWDISGLIALIAGDCEQLLVFGLLESLEKRL